MKTVEDFRAGCLTLLGDAAGRRYSVSMLDMSLREALASYGAYCPRKEPVTVTAARVTGSVVEIDNVLVPGDVLTVRNEAGEWLEHAEYRSGPTLSMTIGAGCSVPSAGDRLRLEVSVPHRIRGLDDAQQTTVPDVHAVTVMKGAACHALRMRARSVTEVFGKRPEDRAALTDQADALELEFCRDLTRIAKMQSFSRVPWQ